MTQEQDDADKELIRRILRGDFTGDNYSKAGYRLTYQPDVGNSRWYVYTSGGFYMLYKWANSTPILNLDWGDQIGDQTIVHLRNLVIEVFEEFERPLAAFSVRAAERGVANYRTTTVVVDRDDWECVFTTARNDGDDHELHWYLSAYDAQETPPLYFLTELPKAAGTVAGAREILKPPSVVAAEAEGLKVIRQGDMFAIPTQMKRDDILKLGAIIKDWDEKEPNYRHRGRPLYGTAHTATRVATLPDGTHLAKGQLLHRPSVIGETRAADHQDRDLPGRLWYVVTKNTTPIAPPRRPR